MCILRSQWLWRHRLELTWSDVLQLEVLVRELCAVDGLASSAVVIGEIAALEGKIFLHLLRGTF